PRMGINLDGTGRVPLDVAQNRPEIGSGPGPSCLETMKLTRRRLFGGIAALGAMGLGGLGLRAHVRRYYDGPPSDHFDGTRFFDAPGSAPKSLADLARWQAARDKAEWPAWAPSPFSDRPPRRVDGAAWRISYVGHASLLIQAGGQNILFDPVWSQRASPFSFAGPKRVHDPGIAFDPLPPIDVVLVSPNHYDHLHAPTLAALITPHRPRVIAPLGNDTIMRAHDTSIRAEAHDWHERVALGPDVAVTLVPSRHWSARGPLDRNKALWAAFVIDTPAGRIFHVADSGYGTGFHFKNARERLGPFPLAILPVGASQPRWVMPRQPQN